MEVFSAAAKGAIRAAQDFESTKRLAAAVIAAIRPSDHVVELDAALGQVTGLIAANTSGAIHAVEATELNEPLQRMLEHRGSPDRVTVVRDWRALGDLARVDLVVTRIGVGDSIDSRLWSLLERLARMPWFSNVRAVVPEVVNISATLASLPEDVLDAAPWRRSPHGLSARALEGALGARPHRLSWDGKGALSRPVRLSRHRLRDAPAVRLPKQTVVFEPTGRGVADAVIIELTAGTANDEYWRPTAMLLPFRASLPVREGSLVPIAVSIDGHSGEWTADTPGSPPRGSRPPAMMSMPPTTAWRRRDYRLAISLAVLREADAGGSLTSLSDRVRSRLGFAVPTQHIQRVLGRGLVEFEEGEA